MLLYQYLYLILFQLYCLLLHFQFGIEEGVAQPVRRDLSNVEQELTESHGADAVAREQVYSRGAGQLLPVQQGG